ncbi:MAG: hypothetical protein AB7F40_04530 [Victivallaceae bacterium]
MSDPTIRISNELDALLRETATHCSRDVSEIFRAAATRVASGHATASQLAPDDVIVVVYRDPITKRIVQKEIEKMYYMSGPFPEKVRNLVRSELTLNEFRAVVAATCLEALEHPATPRFPKPVGCIIENNEQEE